MGMILLFAPQRFAECWLLLVGESKLDFRGIQASGTIATIISLIVFLACSCCASGHSCFSGSSIRSYAEASILRRWSNPGCLTRSYVKSGCGSPNLFNFSLCKARLHRPAVKANHSLGKYENGFHIEAFEAGEM